MALLFASRNGLETVVHENPRKSVSVGNFLVTRATLSGTNNHSTNRVIKTTDAAMQLANMIFSRRSRCTGVPDEVVSECFVSMFTKRKKKKSSLFLCDSGVKCH